MCMQNQSDNIHGYEVKRSVIFENNRGFALAEDPEAVNPFAGTRLAAIEWKGAAGAVVTATPKISKSTPSPINSKSTNSASTTLSAGITVPENSASITEMAKVMPQIFRIQRVAETCLRLEPFT